jgi:hypothetical protein
LWFLRPTLPLSSSYRPRDNKSHHPISRAISLAYLLKFGIGKLLVLKFAEEQRLAADEEPSRFLFELRGKLVLVDMDEHKTEIGIFSATIVDARSAMIERESVFDVFDSESTTIDYYGALYDQKTGDFKPNVVKAASPVVTTISGTPIFSYWTG